MGVQFKESGVVLFPSSGVVAMDPNCCCSQDCPDAAGLGDCACITLDTGYPYYAKTIYFTLSGSSTCYYSNRVPVPCTPVTGKNFSGTYALDCLNWGVPYNNTTAEVLQDQFTYICQNTLGTIDVYVRERLLARGVNVNGPSPVDLYITFQSQVISVAAGSDPTLATPAQTINRIYYYRRQSTTTICDDVYVICGEMTLQSVTQNGSGGIYCDHSTADNAYTISNVYIGTI